MKYLGYISNIQIRSFSTTRSLSIDPSSYTVLAFASKKAVLAQLNPICYIALGLASVLYIQLIRVDPSSAITGRLEHMENLVYMAVELDHLLFDVTKFGAEYSYELVHSSSNIVGSQEALRSLYDTLCEIYTSTSQIYDSFETVYDIINEYDTEEIKELTERLVEVRNLINIRCNAMLAIMRNIENHSIGYEFFTNRMPNF